MDPRRVAVDPLQMIERPLGLLFRGLKKLRQLLQEKDSE